MDVPVWDLTPHGRMTANPGAVRQFVPYPGYWLNEVKKAVLEGDMAEIRKLLADLKQLDEQAGTHVVSTAGQHVDISLARAPEQNYAYKGTKKWTPFKAKPEGSEFVTGPGTFEDTGKLKASGGRRPDVEQALLKLVGDLDKKYPMRRSGEVEPPEILQAAMAQAKEVIDKLGLPDFLKHKLMFKLKTHEYVRGWDSYSDQKGLMQHIAQQGLAFGTGKAFEGLAETLKSLKRLVSEDNSCGSASPYTPGPVPTVEERSAIESMTNLLIESAAGLRQSIDKKMPPEDTLEFAENCYSIAGDILAHAQDAVSASKG